MGRRRRKQEEEKPKADSFTGLFLSLMIILLAFFILLNSMAIKDDAKSRKAIGSLMGSFGILPSGQAFDEEGEQLVAESPILDESAMVQDMVDAVQIYVSSSGIGDPYEDVAFDTLAKNPKLILSGRLLFPHDTVEINPEAFPILNEVVQTATALGTSILVQGHSSWDPERANRYPFAWEASAMRANSVMRYFTEDCALDPSQVNAEGFGTTEPSGPNVGRGKMQNRRIEIVFITQLREQS